MENIVKVPNNVTEGIDMGKHPKLDGLKQLFQKDVFKLTDAQYEKKTGIPLPKDTYYLTHNSALARLAHEEGFEISVQEKTVTFRKKK